MKFFKNCPGNLIVFTNEYEKMIEYFKIEYGIFSEEKLDEKYSTDIEKILDKAVEGSTIVMLTDKFKKFISCEDAKRIFIINENVNRILEDIINNDVSHLIDKIRKGPELITMRNYGDIEKFFKSIKEDFKGQEGEALKFLETKNSGTVITITDHNVNKKIKVNNLYKKAIYTSMLKNNVLNQINVNIFKYINESISKTGWNEYKIKIYDSYDQYKYHYNRLLFLIDILNLGLVLKEGWGLDAGTIFRHVEVYEIFLYSTIKKENLKGILVGAEYLDNGDRFVDLDLFLNKKKVKWSDLKNDEVFKKEEVGIKYRKKLMNRLDNNEKIFLLDLEKRMIQEK